MLKIMFMTDKTKFLLLKVAYEIYKLEPTKENKTTFTFAFKLVLYNLIIDISLILLIILFFMWYYMPHMQKNVIYTNFVILMVGVFILNVINRLVIEYYLNKADVNGKAEIYAKEILKNAPEFFIFNDDEKKIMYKTYVKKMRRL